MLVVSILKKHLILKFKGKEVLCLMDKMKKNVYVIIETYSEYTNSDPGGLMQAGGLTYKQKN